MDILYSVQVNFAAESGEMGVLANHVPSIEQLKPGLIEVIEEAGGSKQFFRMWSSRGSEKGEGSVYIGNMLIHRSSVWRFCRRSARLKAQH